MQSRYMLVVCLVLLTALVGCETINGAAQDLGNTARNIRDILGVGRDIERITK